MIKLSEEHKKSVCELIYFIHISLGIEIDEIKLKWFYDSFEDFVNSEAIVISENKLKKMKAEILTNYKMYLPLCFASFCTAINKVSK